MVLRLPLAHRILRAARHKPQLYLEQVLRLAPHWPTTRMLELSPKYWARTLERLDARQRAIVAGPWELESRLVEPSPVDIVA